MYKQYKLKCIYCQPLDTSSLTRIRHLAGGYGLGFNGLGFGTVLRLGILTGPAPMCVSFKYVNDCEVCGVKPMI